MDQETRDQFTLLCSRIAILELCLQKLLDLLDRASQTPQPQTQNQKEPNP